MASFSWIASLDVVLFLTRNDYLVSILVMKPSSISIASQLFFYLDGACNILKNKENLACSGK